MKPQLRQRYFGGVKLAHIHLELQLVCFRGQFLFVDVTVYQ